MTELLAEINWLAVAVAGLLQIVIGAIWFGPKTFFPVWWRLMGKDPNQQPGNDGMFRVFSITVIAAFVQATTVALVLHSIGAAGAIEGALVGSLLGFGIGAATSVSHRLFGQQGLRIWILEVGQDIIGLTVAGALIASWL